MRWTSLMEMDPGCSVWGEREKERERATKREKKEEREKERE